MYEPPAAVAVSVTLEALGNDALHPGPADPAAIEHEIPAGVEEIVPLPFAPATIERKYELGGGEKLAATVRGELIVTWHASGFSVTGASQPVQVTRLPADGVAMIDRTIPALSSLAQAPFVVTLPEAYVMVQVTPPRLELRVPLAVLPLPLRVSRNFCAAPALAEISPLSAGSVGWSLQAWRNRALAPRNAAPATASRRTGKNRIGWSRDEVEIAAKAPPY